MNDNHLLMTLGGVGAALGIGQLLASQDPITARVILGRAIISGGLGLAAGAALTVLPNLNHVALAGIAGNPKALDWQPLPAQPEHDQQTQTARWDGAQWVVEVRLPGTVSRYQIRRALRSLNRLTAFNNYIASLPADSAVREKWEQATQQFSFGRAWCISIRDGLGLTNAQVMALWRAAETVPEDD